MNDDALLSRLAPVTDEQAAAMVSRQALGELAEEIIGSSPDRPSAVPTDRPDRPGRPARSSRRKLTWAAASTLAAAAAVAVAVSVIATDGQPTRSGKTASGGSTAAGTATGPAQRPTSTSTSTSASTTLTAWTVTENRDGTLKVTIREMDNASGLQATLRADGARVVVTASLAWPAGCVEWRAGDYRMGDQVVQSENRTGLPSADGTEFLIKPSAIPAGALLWVGIGQTGKPGGVVGPPGPTGFGYLTASKACAGS
jgi:hypothetical protein